MLKFSLKSGMLAVFFLALFLVTANATPLISTFDEGTEGWRIWSSTPEEDEEMQLYWDTRGFIYSIDPSLGGTWFFVSPESWSGDWTRFIGGTIEWDLKIVLAGGVFYDGGFTDISILGGDGDPRARLRYYLGEDQKPIIGEWVNYSITLLPENFVLFPAVEESGIDFYGVLSNVDRVYIRGEYIVGNDVAGLDNVRVKPVPEPSTMLLLGAGLLALVGAGRRQFRKKR